MTDSRTPRDTPRLRLVTTLGLFLLMALVAGPARPVHAEDGVERALLEAARRDLPLARRLSAAAKVLAAEALGDSAGTARAALALLPHAPETAGWLLLRASDAGWVPESLRVRCAATIDEGLTREGLTPSTRACLAASGLLVGRRPSGSTATIVAAWPLPDLVRAVLRRELGSVGDVEGAPLLQGDAAAVAAGLNATRPIAALLDQAVSDDPVLMKQGMDALLEAGPASVPLLLHEARQGAAGEPAGREARAARAMLALGFLGDKRATPLLAKALGAPQGWIRVAAATALGDLGDPAGAVALVAHLTNTGDVFRARDQWDYPGTSATNVRQEDWRRVDYFATDVAAADALLRLGVPGAVGWVIHKHLDPSRVNARIRVFQDAHDALRRALRHTDAAPLVAAYNVDSGVAARTRAFLGLAAWWHAHRDETALLTRQLNEDDAGFQKAAGALVSKLLGTDVRSFMITKPALAILGKAATPSLLAALASTTGGSARAELARTLAMVRDPRAVEPLLDLLGDRLAFVRAAGAEALAPYVVGRAAVRAALLRTLRDPSPGPRVSALKALVAAEPSAAVLAAVRAAAPKTKSADWTRAETVVLLVQEGEVHLDAVLSGLGAKDRHVRESWWRLLQLGLELPNHAHNPHPAPETLTTGLTRATALTALAARRSP